MLREIQSNPYWLGNIWYVNTAAVDNTDGPDTIRQIQQPAAHVTSDRWYCITISTEVGVYTSWYASLGGPTFLYH